MSVCEWPARRHSRVQFRGGARLMMVGLDLDDVDATAALLRANVDAMTGPTAIVTSVVRELEPLLGHPRLGPLVRGLTLWATRPPPACAREAVPA